MEWLRRLFGGGRQAAAPEAPRQRSPAAGRAAPVGGGFAALDRAERAAEAARAARERIQARRPERAGGALVDEGAALAEIERLARAGQKIEAIKRYRQLQPERGLKEAKEAIEAMLRGRPLAEAEPVRAALLIEVARLLAAVCEAETSRRQRDASPAGSAGVVALDDEAVRRTQEMDTEARRYAEEAERRIAEYRAEAQRRVDELEAEHQRLIQERQAATAAEVEQTRQANAAAIAPAGVDDAPATPPAAPLTEPTMPADVEALVRAGRTIEAAMAYRQHFPQAGLGDAMDAVSALERRLKG